MKAQETHCNLDTEERRKTPTIRILKSMDVFIHHPLSAPGASPNSRGDGRRNSALVRSEQTVFAVEFFLNTLDTVATMARILDRLGVDRSNWVYTVREFGRIFKQAAGRASSLVRAAPRCSRRWFQGKAAARVAFL